MTTVIVETDGDGINAVYVDDRNVRVVIVDHSWNDQTVVTCPFPSPAPLKRCDATIRKTAEKVIAHPNRPQTIART
jgi:hypothetical protein